MRTCVLIAAKNEGIAIESTINSIVAAGVGKADIYLVSDGSTDNTAELGRTNGVNVLELLVNGGKSVAIAKGIKHFNLASYDLLALADADTTFEAGYFAAMVAAFKKTRMPQSHAARLSRGRKTGSLRGGRCNMRLATG